MNTTALNELDKVIRIWSTSPSVIKPKLDCKGIGTGVRWWRVQLVDEETEDDNDNPNIFYNQQFEDCIRWADEKLEDWPNCKRMAFDMWDFKHRKDAEKFITFFHLSWQQ